MITSIKQFENECQRCLDCRQAPCISACPLHISPKEFISLAKKKDYTSAIKTIYNKNPLGLICGYICPNNFCMKVCLRCKIDRAVNIPAIQAVIIEQYRKDFKFPKKNTQNGLKIAVIGSGPAGIGAVWKLSDLGYCVELFEGGDKLGGSLNLIPEERLPHHAIEYDYQHILNSNNVIVHLNTMVRKPENLLKQGFSGVIIATGTQNVNNLGIEGEEHIVSYVDYLSHPEEYSNISKIAIIGGGKVAADCALTAHKQNAKIIQMLIRRNTADMRMSETERDELQNYGVELIPLTRVTKVQKQTKGLACTLCKTQIINDKCIDDEKTPLKKQQYDLVIKAIGGSKIAIQENSLILCAGDCKNGTTTAIESIASGIEAAIYLNDKLNLK